MFAACDIGNSRIKLGLFKNDKISEFRSFEKSNDFNMYILSKKIQDIAISSVVPQKLNEITNQLKSNNLNPYIISKKSKFNLTLNYDSIETLGIDRICGCEGAYFLLKKSDDFKDFKTGSCILVIDFGTATTLNIIIYPSEFIGGMIAPGIRMMFNSLNNSTAQLPDVSIESYKNFVGRDTSSSIASGVINATTGLIEKTFLYLKEKMSAEKIWIYITGGNAENFPQHLNFDFEYEKGLVLYGIKSIFEKNNKK